MFRTKTISKSYRRQPYCLEEQTSERWYYNEGDKTGDKPLSEVVKSIKKKPQ
jgi:hypothetical protein